MIQPIRDKVLVKPFAGDEFTGGGIAVPDSFRKESDKVKVIAVGAGTKERPMKLNIGDIGFRVSGWGTPIEENGELFYLMEDKEIRALL